MRGLFRHEMMRIFPVIVAEQVNFRKYRAKRMKYPYEYCGMICFHSFLQKFTMVSVVFF